MSAPSVPHARYPTRQYPSTHFVESAGTILFNRPAKTILVLHQLNNSEYVLPKGRVNVNETKQIAAVRETTEETGFVCRLLPVNMWTRAPPEVELEQAEDLPRWVENGTEPISLQVRDYKGGVKLVWWFVAEVVEGEEKVRDELDQSYYRVEWAGYEEAVEKLTFETDKDVVRKAVELVKGTYGA